MISKIVVLVVILYSVSSVSPYVVTWTGDDEITHNSSNRPLLGAHMCTRGPSYWCHNITHAKECHAVQHCISKVWEKMQVPEDNDSVCQICKDMVQQARDQLLSNETQDELRQVLEGSCNLIPLKPIASECRKLSDEFIPELVDTLASRMDPVVVCTVSGLCNSARIDAMLEKNQVPAKFDLKKDSCPKCQYYMGKAMDFLKGLPENTLLEDIIKVCGRLGSFSDSCSSLVLKYRNDIYNHVQTQMNSQEFCALVGLCEMTGLPPRDNNNNRVHISQESTAVRVWTPPSQNDDLPCDFCKQMVTHLKEWLLANTTRGEFRDLVTGICKNLKKYRKECLNLAQEYGKPLYQLLVDETDPDRLCGTIGICPNYQGKFRLFSKQLEGPIWTILPTHNDDEEPEELFAPMLSLRPAERLTGDDDLVVAVSGNEIQKNSKVEGKIQCQFCEYALHALQEYIENPKTEANIRDAVDKLCTRLPKEMSDQCIQFVNSYGDSVVNMLAQEVDPSVICPQLGLCDNSSADVVIPKPIPRVDRRPSNIEDIPTCPLCHFAVAKIINMIGANKTKAAIDHALDEVCYVMPRHLKQDCLSFMTYYGNQIGEMLVLEVTAREVCLALHLCILPQENRTGGPAKSKVVGESPLPLDRFMPQAMLKGELAKVKAEHPELATDLERGEKNEAEKKFGDNKCVICEFVIEQLVQRLSNNATEEEIKEEVEHACEYLPKTVRKPCENFVETYGEMVIQYLTSSADPQEICTELGLCSAAGGGSRNSDNNDDSTVAMGKCQLCMVLSDYLSAMLDDPRVDTSIDEIVEKVCPVLPRKYRVGCKEMIEDYGPYLMSLLAQATDKGKACSTLNLC